jgi:hypothetical protein
MAQVLLVGDPYRFWLLRQGNEGMTHNAFDQLREARKLPPGHTGLKKAQERLDRIYAASRELEQKWVKKLGRRFRNLMKTLSF